MALIDYAGTEGDAYHRERHKEFFESPTLTEAWAAFIHRVYFPDLPKGATFLEVGAGLGTNLLSIKDIADVYAVEPAQAAREQCQKHGLRSFSKLQDLPAGLRFDYVMIRHVLEHVQDPRAMLLEVQTLLKPAGQLVIALPSEPAFAKPDPDDIDHHLYSWNRQTIANLLKDCGYTVVDARLNWRNGRRLFLPLYRMFGVRAYTFALRTLGWLRRYCEIVVVAKSAT
jgi:SAM-dependent methyltransferase